MSITDSVSLSVDRYHEIIDEPYMSKKQKLYFFDVLKAWYDALSGEMKSFKCSLQAAEQLVDELDRASHEESQRIGLKSSDRRRKLREKVKDALDRIQNNEYGYCKTCDAEIGIPRLSVRPTADECINCKTVSELHELRGG